MGMLMNLEGVWQEDWQNEEEGEENGLATTRARMNEQQVLPPPLAAGADALGSPVHMQLFYNQVIGRTQQQQQDKEEDDAKEDGAADSSMPPPPPLRKQPRAMSMDAHCEQQQH
jgi:hypothetical protein